MAPVTVAIAGATGNLGIPIFNAFNDANYPLVILTRAGSSSTSKLPKSSNITIKEVDYTSVPSLTSALKGVKVVVSVLATTSVGEQKPLIDAAAAAGVERFIPSEFGCDTVNPKTAALPVFKYKVETQDYLKAKAKENPNFSYTFVITGPFFDWGLDKGFFLNPAKHTTTLFNRGDATFSTTTLATVGKAVVGVAEHLAETKNRAVYVHDTATTQNTLIGYAKEKDGKEWDTSAQDTEEVYAESMKELSSGGNIGKAMVELILVSIFGGDEYGANYTGHTDNELLGLKEFTPTEVKAVVQSLV